MKKNLLTLLAFGLAQASFCQTSTPKKLDELMSAYCKVNKFNGSVLVSQKGSILFEKGYGLKNAREKTMNDTKSIFQTYSITKTFTSTVILKLVELHQLALTDKLSKFYPAFPKGDSISIEHLLTHTSGIYDYTRGNDMPDQTENSFIRFIETKPLDFPPGSNWSYSNSGYWLLGFIISKITGMPYERAVSKYIFRPLHMTQSGFDFKHLVNKNKTTGYEIFNEEEKKDAVLYDPPGPFAAGAIYSTVLDLYKYHNGLLSYKILTKKTLKKAFTSFKNNYGYGWMTRNIEGLEIVSHSGGAAGFRSNFVLVPKKDICIVLLNNNENANVEHIAKNLIHLLTNKPYTIPVEININKAILERYIGYYAVNPLFSMHITIAEGRLSAQATGQGKITVFAEKENYFLADEVEGFLEFIKDNDGLYNDLIIHQGGQNISAKRYYPTWGLIGTATSKGWEDKTTDIQMTEDSLNKGSWLIKNIKLNTGEFKFRFNNDWSINYGDNENDELLDLSGENIKIGAGTYDIILDFTNEKKPRYHISKKL